jgi:hypothetical protein
MNITNINKIKSFIWLTIIILVSIVLCWYITRLISNLSGVSPDIRADSVEEWIISKNNKEWIAVQPANLTDLSPFLLTNDWEGALINQLHSVYPKWPTGFRVCDPSLTEMSRSVALNQLPSKTFLEFYNESKLSQYILYNNDFNTTFHLSDVWPKNGLSLPFKTSIHKVELEIEPNIFNEINYYRSEALNLSDKSILQEGHNSVRLEKSFIQKLIKRFHF